MRALVHYPDAGAAPVGVWWPTGTLGPLRSVYVDPAWALDGSRAVYGENYDGHPISAAEWDYICDRLIETSNPFLIFSSHDTKSPESLLIRR